ncbi:MAG: ATP-dependent Clp protease proteolytic subunit [Acidimicrobiales bacterium]
MPSIVEQTRGGGERATDLFSKLLTDNIIFLGSPIDDHVANIICAELLYLESENPDRGISLYINSPGGDVNAMFAIYDTMQFIRPDVATICFGQAASAAAVLLAAGAPGQRMALPSARILLHQPYSGAQGQVSDLEIAAAEIERLRVQLEENLAHHTGQSVEKIKNDTERDFVMTAAEAKAYGVIDDVISHRNAADTTGPIRALDS